ncbi:MAG: hypothetical protein ABSH44_10295 [Bryobacteraceae bacterium]
MRLRLLASVLLVCAAAALGEAAELSISVPLYEGAKAIKGTAATATGRVTAWVNLRKAEDAEIVNGSFEVRLSHPLQSGDLVQVKEEVGGRTVESEAVRVARQSSLAALTLNPIKNGDSVLTGRTALAGASVNVSVNGAFAGHDTANERGEFKVALQAAVSQGNFVVATVSAGGESQTASTEAGAAAPRTTDKKVKERPIFDFYTPFAQESEIRGLQERLRDYRAGRVKDAGPVVRAKKGGPPVGCTVGEFKKDTEDLKTKLETRLKELQGALAKALPEEKKWPGGRKREQYEREVRAIRAAIAITQVEIHRVPNGVCPLRLSPFNLVTIYEHTDRERILHYSPVNADLESETFAVDKSSKLRIEINADTLASDAVLGQLKMSATLTGSDGKSAKVEVINYAQIDVDPKSQKSQQGVNTQAARDLKGTIEDLYYTTEDLVANLYGEDPLDWSAKWWTDRNQPGVAQALLQNMDKSKIDGLDRGYKYKKDEIVNIVNALTASPVLVRMVAEPVFGMNSATMKALATDFTKNLDIMLGAQYKPDAVDAARLAVVQTTLAVFNDLMYTQDYIEGRELIAPSLPDGEAADEEFDEMYRQEIEQMKSRILPGEIDLPSYQAQDGGQLVLQIQMQSASDSADGGGNSLGSPATSSASFTVQIKDYRTRAEVVDSAFYIRRLNDVPDANGKLTRVNFPAAAGVTLDVTFRNRGPFHGLLHKCADQTGVLHELNGGTCNGDQTELLVSNAIKRNRFFTALAPGLGVNVSLLSFPNPGRLHLNAQGQPALNSQNQPYDVDSPAAVQVGAGFVGSVFGGMVQFTFGWDLNVEAPRAYWGVGFSFTKVAQAAVTAAKKL